VSWPVFWSAVWVGSLSALAVALIFGLGHPASGQSRQETLIIARNIDDYTTNDPSRQYEFTGQMTNQSVYDTLVTVDAPDLTRVQPKLATKWEMSKDGTIYTFTLRSGVKFTSGNPLTAADVKFSFRRLKNLKDNPAFFLDAGPVVWRYRPPRASVTFGLRYPPGSPVTPQT
jgi:peptide/nickel transport system substrate-binding protein